MMVSIPSAVTVIQLETAPFRNAADAKDWALSHGIVGRMSNEDTRGKGEIAISITSLEKMLSGSALRKSVTPDIHYASLMRLRDIIRESFVAEVHPDYRKVNGVRSIDNGINVMVEIAVLWQMFGGLGFIFRTQAIAILVNKYFGPSVNAAMGIANQASSQTQTLAAAMQGAFQPAIATAFGANEIDRMRALAYRASKFAILLTLTFMIPIAVELDLLLELWLKTPPPYTVGLCYCMLAMLLFDKASAGQCLACNASGRIAAYQATGGAVLILTLPIAWMFVALGL